MNTMMQGGIDPLSMMVVLVTLAAVPFAAMIVTSYTKVVVVLGLLRNALGVQQVPPNMVLNGIAIIISIYVMAPVTMEAQERMQQAPTAGNASPTDQVLGAAGAAREPLRRFLVKHANETEKIFFMKAAHSVWPAERAKELRPDDLLVIAPAFLLTELTASFRIGFLLYLAFVIIDLVIANVLLAMGLSQVSPTNIAIPFKLLLFVLLDGWSVLMHGLVLTYA